MSDKIRAYLLDNMQDALADELDAELAELEGAQDRRDKWCKLAVDMINELRDDYAPGDLGELDGVKAIRKLRTELDEARKFIEDEAFVTLKARMWLEAHPKGNDNE